MPITIITMPIKEKQPFLDRLESMGIKVKPFDEDHERFIESNMQAIERIREEIDYYVIKNAYVDRQGRTVAPEPPHDLVASLKMLLDRQPVITHIKFKSEIIE